ncbi:GlxA family transcriptional regulator [Nocardia sp. NPDC002869]|uniref:GlxA family transcriptional regulator n=1 Tax=Nocardia sp. NPDC002869 TaxID=3161032 RepID=UPI00398D5C31
MAEVFGTPREGLPGRYDFLVCTEYPGEVTTTAGYTMRVPAGLGALATADTVVIPGWLPFTAEMSPAVLEALRAAAARGARLVSICTGAFALAQTGLLDGRTATTHWARTGELRARFPRVQVDPGVLYVDHGDIATSAGAGAGIDLCLHLVRSDHGALYASELARHMVMPPHREGGQAQFVPAPVTPHATGESVAALLHWSIAHLDRPLTLSDLAGRAGVSPRTLARRFEDQLGTSPGRWLLTQRVTAARRLLEETDLPVEAIAARVGLTSATNLRRRFHTLLGTTPAAYRRAFRGRPTGRSHGWEGGSRRRLG